MKGRDHLDCLDVAGRFVLQWILYKHSLGLGYECFMGSGKHWILYKE
jgi:hypothetical protein